MKTLFIIPLALAAVAAGFLVQFAFSGTDSEASSHPTIIAVTGVADIQGEPALVHISVLVGPGQNPDAVADAMLRAQGARRVTPEDLESDAYTTIDLSWPQFSDGDPANDFVTQYYNPSGEPGAISGQTALTNSHTTWTGVATSSFAFAFGGTTTRCPSLVDECGGVQFEDGFNDLQFKSLKGPCNFVFGCTLGVTWHTSDEADVALNTKVSWNGGCVDQAGSTDVETVILHENGHVVGLGHTAVGGAIMATPYTIAQCLLGQDDIDGVTALYPVVGTPAPTDTPGGPTATATDTPPPTATPAATSTPSSTTAVVDDISYSTNGGGQGDRHLNISISVIDGDGQPVGGASVSIDLNVDDGLYATGTGSTGAGGTITFKATNAPSGCYDTVVTDVTAAGLTWDESFPANEFAKNAAC